MVGPVVVEGPVVVVVVGPVVVVVVGPVVVVVVGPVVVVVVGPVVVVVVDPVVVVVVVDDDEDWAFVKCGRLGKAIAQSTKMRIFEFISQNSPIFNLVSSIFENL